MKARPPQTERVYTSTSRTRSTAERARFFGTRVAIRHVEQCCSRDRHEVRRKAETADNTFRTRAECVAHPLRPTLAPSGRFDGHAECHLIDRARDQRDEVVHRRLALEALRAVGIN